MDRFIDKLGYAVSELDLQFTDANCGGCGAIAVMLYRLAEQLGLNPVIRNYDGSHEPSIDEVRNDLMTDPNHSRLCDWNAHGMWFTHVWVEFSLDGTYYAMDACGVVEAQDMYDYWGSPRDGYFTVEEMESLGNDHGGWNPTFDRDQLPYMTDLVDEMYEALKQEVAA